MILKFKDFKGRALPFILFALVAASAFFTPAQDISNSVSRYMPEATPVPVQKSKPIIVAAPTPPVDKNKEKYKNKKQILNEADTPAEKSIKVDAKVNFQLCVSEGRIKINGWDRNEIRAYVGGGSQIGFVVLKKNKDNPVWVKAIGFDPVKNTEPDADECLSGEEIEIDVPRGASVQIKGTESETLIESVRKVNVGNLSGDIFLNDIAEGIDATTYQGGVTVGKSSGAMSLTTTDGNIVAYEVSPSEVGDVFRAKTTNGMITLQQIEHGQTEVSSNSGSIRFNGEFVSGGQYNFNTQKGSILMTIPEKSSCLINAFFGYGQFNSDIKLLNEKRVNPSGLQTLTGQIGSGEATVTLKTYNGRINIRKSETKN
jgi:Rieske Fe-S protein